MDISGTTGPNTLNGTYFGDYIFGLAGNDILNGGYGSDSLYGDREYWYQTPPAAGGTDTLRGGFGDDWLYGDAGNDSLSGDSGDDWLEGGAGQDTMNGGSGDDDISVGKSLAELTGDKVIGGTGTDKLIADFSFRTSAVTFAALDSVATYSVLGFTITGVERYQLVATSFNDTLTGWLHDDWFKAGAGVDTLRGRNGNDQLEGGEGADTIYGGSGRDLIYGDDYSSQAFADILFGEDGADSVYGYGGNDKASGGRGNDTVSGDAGDDQVAGDDGNDNVYGGEGADAVTGGNGDDSVGSDSNTIGTAYGDDGVEKDTVDGGAGNDSVLVGVGDIGIGGTGTDIARLSFTQSAIAISYTLTAAVVTLQNGTRIDGFEQLDFAGGTAGDQVTGGGLTDYLNGGDGNDTLTGGSGNDILDGEAGDDTVNGGIGSDTLYDDDGGDDTLNGGDNDDYIYVESGADKANGDAGNDTFYMDDDYVNYNSTNPGFAPDTVNGGTGTDKLDFFNCDMPIYLDLTTQTNNDGAVKGDRFSLIENVAGTIYDDVIVGTAGANLLEGGGSDDVLKGMDGNDRLVGGTGSDIMSGGGGADRFLLEAGFNTTYWPDDLITDFTRGSDKLEIDDSVFGANWTFSSGAGISSGTTSAPHIRFDTATSRLWYDPDGNLSDGEPILIATLSKVTALAATDFVVV